MTDDNTDIFWMRQALQLARYAAKKEEVPVGSLLVSKSGDLWGKGYNKVEQLYSQAEHAEIRAIRMACRKQKNWRLTGATLYCTLEPCMMCLNLAVFARVERIVYGASSPIFGFHIGEEGIILRRYTKKIKNIVSGVLAEESAQLLRGFFSKRRMAHHE